MDEIKIELVGGALDGTDFVAVEEEGRRNFKEWLQKEEPDPGTEICPELFKDMGPPFQLCFSSEDGDRLMFLVGELQSTEWLVLQYSFHKIRKESTAEGVSWRNTHLYRYTKVYAKSDGARTTQQIADRMKS